MNLQRGGRALRLFVIAAIVLVTGTVLVPTTSTYAATIVVSTPAQLSSAITTINGGTGGTYTVYVEPGTYTMTSVLDINPPGALNLTICGSTNGTACDANPSQVVIDGNSAHIVFLVEPNPSDNGGVVPPVVTITFQGLTIQNGQAADGTGGGGLQVGNANQYIIVNNCIFKNNKTLNAGAQHNGGAGDGGAIYYVGDGQGDANNSEQLTVTNSTFDSNSVPETDPFNPPVNGVVSPGAGIEFLGGSQLTVTGSTFTNNIAGVSGCSGSGCAPGQGAAISFQNSDENFPAHSSITNNTFIGNHAYGTFSATGDPTVSATGGAIWNGGGAMTLKYNRFLNNTADGSGNDIWQQADYDTVTCVNYGKVTGDHNWYGVNTGPSSADVASSSATCGGKPVATQPTVSPWIVLKTTANPNPIQEAQSTTLTTDFLHDSSGANFVGSNLGLISTLIGLPVKWTNAVHGTLSNAVTSIQSGGTATATFTQDGTCNTSSGEAEVDNVPNGDTTATGTVTVDCPDLTATKTNSVSGITQLANGATCPPQCWTWTVTAANIDKGHATFTDGQTILTDNLPNRNISYGSVTVTPNSGVSGTVNCSINGTDDLTCTAGGTVTINGSDNAPAGSFTASFTATPSAIAAYGNPRSGGICKVDPNNVVSESNENNNTCSDSVNVTAPDLTVATSNNVGGTTTLGNNWTWKLHVANSSTAATATFTNGQTILTDDLPSSNVTYGSPSAGNGTNITGIGNVSCSTASSTLTCTATGTVTIGTSGSFDVTLTATPSATGTYTNPRSGGACSVDPNNVVPETNENNNTCNADSVTVTKASTTTTLASSKNPSTFGDSVTFTATIGAPASALALVSPTGTVDFFDGGAKIGSGTLSTTGGVTTATFTTSALTGGIHTITATYNGDGNYLSSSASGAQAVTQGVNKASTTTALTSSQNPSTFGQSVTFTATISAAASALAVANPTGTVDFLDGGAKIGSGTLSTTGGVTTASFSTNSLTGGTHTITATYNGDTNYGSSSGTLSGGQTVNPASTTTTLASSKNPSSLGDSVTFTATIGATASALAVANPTGTVDFFDGNTRIGTGNLSTTAGVTTASFSTSSLTVGTHTITATYNGDGNYSSSSASGAQAVSQGVNKASTSTTVTSSKNPSALGGSVTFTATIGATASALAVANPTGSVDFFDGNTKIGSGNLSTTAGVTTATFTTSSLAGGNHTITANYGGDGNYTSSSGTLSDGQTVNQASTTTTLASSKNPSNFGDSVTFTATISAAASALVLANPTGSVDFFDGNTKIGTGNLSTTGGVTTATFTTSALTGGNHTITATYNGDTNYSSSSASGAQAVTQGVSKVSTTTTLASSKNPSTFGDSVTFTASISAPSSATAVAFPGGTVDFFDGQTKIGSGTVTTTAGVTTATFTISSLAVSSHTITATYNGDTNYASSSASGAQAVSQGVNKAGTTTTLASSQNPSSLGQSVTFTATIAAPASAVAITPPTGTVDFFDGNTKIGTGTASTTGGVTTATVTTSGLSIGKHTITATYSGDGDYSGGSTTQAVSQVVTTASTTTTVTSSRNPSTFGDSVTFTATIGAPSSATAVAFPTGSVTFFDGQTQLGSGTLSTTAGVTTATFSTSALTGGSHTITATYNGDGNYSSSSGSLPNGQTINPASTTTTLASSKNPSTFGDSITFTATITAPASATAVAFPGGTVDFFDGQTKIGTGTVSTTGGVTSATFTTSSLTGGSHTITAAYNGDGNYSSSSASGAQAFSQGVNKASSTTTLASSQNPSTPGQSVTFTATIAAAASALAVANPTGTVDFFDGGGKIGSGTVSTTGGVTTATFTTTSLSAGPHTITATYNGDGNYGGSTTAQALTQVVKQAITIGLTSSVSPSLLNQAVTFTATVAAQVSGAGTPSGTVQFSIDGVNQGSAVNLNGGGQASLSISSLAVGSHTVTATYSGDANFLGGASKGLTQQVTYKVCLLYNPGTPLVHGSTVMIRLTLCDVNSANVSSQSTVLTVTGVSPAPGVPGPSGTFGFVSTLGRPVGGYQYYLNTSGYGPGAYNLLFTDPGDPVTHQAAFTLS